MTFMAFTAYTLTLSRWHHVADRIKVIAEAKHQEALRTLGNTVIQQHLSASQVDALKARGARALGLIQEAREALAVVGAIRMALAQANADKRITVLLAEAEAKRREAKMLADYASIDLLTRTPLSNVNKAIEANLAQPKDPYGGGSRGVDVNLVAEDALDFVNEERIHLQAAVASITDQVAELNRATLTLDLPSKLAKDAGL